MVLKNEPSLKNLTDKNYGRIKKTQNKELQELIRPHIDSFNYAIREGLDKVAKNIEPLEFEVNERRVKLDITDIIISKPQITSANQHSTSLRVYPAECRERRCTYAGKLQISLKWNVDGFEHTEENKLIGNIPVMVKSNLCHLDGYSPAQLINRGEEAEEFGGYFIVNGLEKIVRMLIMPRRNYPVCLIRPSWRTRGPEYSQYGVVMRSVRDDQTSTNITLHYLNNGSVNLALIYRREVFYMPIILILKCLINCTDQYLYNELIKGKEDNSFFKGCMANMLRQAQDENFSKQKDILNFIGSKFRHKLPLPEWKTDREVAVFLINQTIMIHLDKFEDKFNTLVFMVRKLFSLAKGECCAENADNPMFWEVLLGGHLYLMYLKEKLETWLAAVKANLIQTAGKKKERLQWNSTLFNTCMRRPIEPGVHIEAMLATGNIATNTGLGLMQASGLTVNADKLNFYRYLSHFRSVHRGQFFSTMRTTAVRRLLPEAWGFICPVHTPDGAPCGLLNHLAADCMVVNVAQPTGHIPELMTSLGMTPYDSPVPGDPCDCLSVSLDGKMIGWLPPNLVQSTVDKLRYLKVLGKKGVPSSLEICYVPRTPVASQYPCVALFSGIARLMRPVKNLALNQVEMIGTFEQLHKNICVTLSEAIPGLTTHQEIREDSMLSVIASLTPYSDFNQSPRNMYQCQMGKQTMGTPSHVLERRSDNKMYKIQTPQSPLVRPYKHDRYSVDDYPQGTNAVVAVISYTGYDMEDAMIINKSSYDRGFTHGTVLKTLDLDLSGGREYDQGYDASIFCKADEVKADHMGPDGLPYVGTKLELGMLIFCAVNIQTGIITRKRYRLEEPCYVHQVRAMGHEKGDRGLNHVIIVLRYERNPIIGDKFASRAGQKGICSQLWPVENMPFSESGMQPDIIFNPHGFPSRMTIGMMIELMAGKSGATHGLCHDATPFTFSEDQPAIDHFGQLLTKAGYNYYGTERMYSGVDGRELEANIFMGIVYYQRLRHMVSDKFQVRTTGPVDPIMRQPVKGRKRGGGVRFGEMERDALLAHGTSFLLSDRLFNNSDRCQMHVCVECGSLMSPQAEKGISNKVVKMFYEQQGRALWTCLLCKKSQTVKVVDIPYVFSYLVAELASINIKVTLDVKKITEHA